MGRWREVSLAPVASLSLRLLSCSCPSFSLPTRPLAFFTSFTLFLIAAAAAKSLQLCPTLCDPIDGSPPGSPVPGILHEFGNKEFMV